MASYPRSPTLPQRHPARPPRIAIGKPSPGLSREHGDLWEHALSQYRAYDWQAAADAFLYLSRVVPSDAGATCCLINAALTFSRMGEYETASHVLGQAASIDDVLPLTLFIIGVIETELHHLGRALECFNIALNAMHGGSQSYHHLGLSFALARSDIQHNLRVLRSRSHEPDLVGLLRTLPLDSLFEPPLKSPVSAISSHWSSAGSSGRDNGRVSPVSPVTSASFDYRHDDQDVEGFTPASPHDSKAPPGRFSYASHDEGSQRGSRYQSSPAPSIRRQTVEDVRLQHRAASIKNSRSRAEKSRRSEPRPKAEPQQQTRQHKSLPPTAPPKHTRADSESIVDLVNFFTDFTSGGAVPSPPLCNDAISISDASVYSNDDERRFGPVTATTDTARPVSPIEEPVSRNETPLLPLEMPLPLRKDSLPSLQPPPAEPIPTLPTVDTPSTPPTESPIETPSQPQSLSPTSPDEFSDSHLRSDFETDSIASSTPGFFSRMLMRGSSSRASNPATPATSNTSAAASVVSGDRTHRASSSSLALGRPAPRPSLTRDQSSASASGPSKLHIPLSRLAHSAPSPAQPATATPSKPSKKSPALSQPSPQALPQQPPPPPVAPQHQQLYSASGEPLSSSGEAVSSTAWPHLYQTRLSTNPAGTKPSAGTPTRKPPLHPPAVESSRDRVRDWLRVHSSTHKDAASISGYPPSTSGRPKDVPTSSLRAYFSRAEV